VTARRAGHRAGRVVRFRHAPCGARPAPTPRPAGLPQCGACEGPIKPGAAREVLTLLALGVEPSASRPRAAGEVLRTSHNADCPHSARSRAELAPWAPRGQSALCLRPLRGHKASCGWRRKGFWPGASRSYERCPRPATRPAPEGPPQLPPLAAQRSAVLAASRPSPAGAAEPRP